MTAVLLSLVLSAVFAGVAAAAGELDVSFGSGGKVTTAIGAGDDEINAVAVQADRKIVTAGGSRNGGDYDIAVARFNADGSPDTSFDGDGKLTADIAGGYDILSSVAIQPDGKIVVAGFASIGPTMDFFLARYNTNGSLDTSFDTNGVLVTSFGPGNDEARSIAIQPDGKIVAAGYGGNGTDDDIALARYNADGSLDTGFDGDGKLMTTIGSGDDNANALAIEPSGKYVVAGYSFNGSNYDFALARYSAGGVLDSSFDGDGKLTTAIGSGYEFASAVGIQADGKIVAAGGSDAGGFRDVALARYNTNGSLDTGFDGDGKLTTPIGLFDDTAYALLIQTNGKIVAAGNASNGGAVDFALTRFNADGSLDSGFDGDGKLATAFGTGDDGAFGAALQPDGKILAGGYWHNGANSDFALARYLGDAPSMTPTAKVVSPSLGRTKAGALKAFSGTAGPAGYVAKVEIALRRVDRRQLARKRCLWLNNAKSVFVKRKARRKRCAPRRFLAAKGTDNWTFKLRRRLPTGRYELYVRVTLTTGERHTTYSREQGNLRKFTIF